MWRHFTVLAFVMTGLGTPVGSGLAARNEVLIPQGCLNHVVQTESGGVCGNLQLGVERFLGIPYAQSTAGKNRWQPPLARGDWRGVLPALNFGPACPQNGEQTLSQSEDCLSLNIWTPAAQKSSAFPVLVFIHGGAFQTGSSGDPLPTEPSQPLYDGARLASSQRIVVVTLNYRLGALGFLAGVNGLSGNFGLMDQQRALQWVQNNIAAFGGDPSRVTLSGESAGAMSVGLHLLSAPGSAGLFRSAIMQSNPLNLPYRTISDARRGGEYFSLALGCYFQLEPLRCLRDQPLEKILQAQQAGLLAMPTLEFGLSALLPWAPVIDQHVITRQPLEVNMTKPVLMGVNSNEGDLFVGLLTEDAISDSLYSLLLSKLFRASQLTSVQLRYPLMGTDNRAQLARLTTDYLFYCATRALARRSNREVYAYQYTYSSETLTLWPKLSVCKGKACHSDELPYTFNNLGSRAVSSQDRLMGQQMSAYWGAFVRDERPNAKDAPSWMPYDAHNESMLELGRSTAMRPINSERCSAWQTGL